MRLIVAEVVLELGPCTDAWPALEVLPKPEGTTYYPDARVYVRTEAGTPTWVNGMRLRRRARAIAKAYIGPN